MSESKVKRREKDENAEEGDSFDQVVDLTSEIIVKGPSFGRKKSEKD